jgi:hypothetical protein
MAEKTCHDCGIGILEAEVKKFVNLKLPAMAEASSDCLMGLNPVHTVASATATLDRRYCLIQESECTTLERPM